MMKWMRKRGHKGRRQNDENRDAAAAQDADETVPRQELDEDAFDALDYQLVNEETTQSKGQKHWAILRSAVLSKKFHRPSTTQEEPKTLQDAEKAMEQPISLTPMLLMLGAYVCLGVTVYCWGEQWPIRDSLYFIVVTLLTVGYGDLSPSTAGMKAFTIMFASVGVGLLGSILGIVGQVFVKMQMERWEHIQGEQAKNVLNQFEKEDDTTTGEESFHQQSQKQQPFMTRVKESAFVIPFCHVILIMVIGTTVLSLAENWSIIDALYWTFVTTTTIGYGDNVPETGATRWFSIFFLPMAVYAISEVLGKIARTFVDKDIAQAEQDLFNSKVTVDDLIAMDIDGDGHVTKLEYFEFMLKAMGKVDQNMLDKLHAQFQRLDADGSGTLETSDLELLARRERGVNQSKRALELTMYKSQHVQQTPETRESGQLV